MSYPIGISAFGEMLSDPNNLFLMKEAGIDAVEVSESIPYSDFDFEALKKRADAAGIRLWSIHNQYLPIDSMNAPDPRLNQMWIDRMQDVANRAAAVGIDKMVIHSCDCDGGDREEDIKRSMHCINELVEYAHPKGMQIALENLPRGALGMLPDEHLRMLSCNDKLRSCFDFNHCITSPTEEYFEAVAHRLITVHVSDRDEINERHWLPGEGTQDWVRIMERFDKIGYTGVWMYEVSIEPGPTIDRRPLAYTDFVENAKALFAHKQPAPIGTPYPNLGMWGPKDQE